MYPTNRMGGGHKSSRVGPPVKGGTSQNAASSAGSSKHFSKMAKQSSQLKGAGATTGGLATGGSTRVHNSSGKLYSKGKN